jgi:hypothetical protein
MLNRWELLRQGVDLDEAREIAEAELDEAERSLDEARLAIVILGVREMFPEARFITFQFSYDPGEPVLIHEVVARGGKNLYTRDMKHSDAPQTSQIERFEEVLGNVRPDMVRMHKRGVGFARKDTYALDLEQR